MSKRVNPLIGKTLTGIVIPEARDFIVFQMGEDSMTVWTYADCCSYTWIEGYEPPALGFPCTVTGVRDLTDVPDKPESPFHTNTESVQYYGCEIKTDKGDIQIDYRNDSNGYYGGNLVWEGWDRYDQEDY